MRTRVDIFKYAGKRNNLCQLKCAKPNPSGWPSCWRPSSYFLHFNPLIKRLLFPTLFTQLIEGRVLPCQTAESGKCTPEIFLANDIAHLTHILNFFQFCHTLK